ncbi:MAG: hypothetical protein HUJ93_04265, partial [Bacteroidales bacterium]|nr:hypothetical protein [Bacteroidales bacterium]
MKKINLAIAVFSALIFSFGASAQINTSVEVKRNYEVDISSIRKPVAPVKFADSLARFDVASDYSIFNRPYRDLYEFTPYQVAGLAPVEREGYKYVSLRAGVQYPFEYYLPVIPEISLDAQLVAKDKFNLGIYGTNSYARGETLNGMGEIMNSTRLKANVGGYMKIAWNKGEFNLWGDYKHNGVTDSMKADSVVNRGQVFTVNCDLKSADRDENSLYYDVNVLYRQGTNANSSLLFPSADSIFKENLLVADAYVGKTYDVYRVYLDVYVKNVWLGGEQGLGHLEITPIYEYRKQRLNAKIGIKFGNRFGTDTKTNIFPDLDARYETIKDALWLRAVVGGGNDLVTMSDFIGDTPWLNPAFGSPICAGSRPIDAKISAESILVNRLALNAIASYTIYKDKCQLLTAFNEAGIPMLYYSFADYQKLSAAVESSWKSRDFKFFASLQYNYYKPAEGV